MSTKIFVEEGDKCPECKTGTMHWPEIDESRCACHISPPCAVHSGNRLECDECGHVDTSPDKQVVSVDDGISQYMYRPRPLDRSKIDYRKTSRGPASMLVKGVYPEGTTMEEVRRVVDGTFGGEFVSFRNGQFTFIAYTD